MRLGRCDRWARSSGGLHVFAVASRAKAQANLSSAQFVTAKIAKTAVARLAASHRRRLYSTPNGGTSYLTYRDDRFRCVSGAKLLTGHRLRESSPTQRMVASCCNSAMFLKFSPGHWVSAYRLRFEGDRPPIEMRNQTRHRSDQTAIAQDAPSHLGYPPMLIVKLLGSRVAMLIGR